MDRVPRLLSFYSVVTCFVADCDERKKQMDGQVQKFYGLGPLACYFVQGDQDDRASLASRFDHVINDRLMTSIW